MDMYEDLNSNEWVGIVEENDDPSFLGRCKIRVYGKFDGRTDSSDPNSEFIIPTEKLPWAIPSNSYVGGSSTGGGSFSVPKKGSLVKITFDNNSIYSPVYHNNIYESQEVLDEIQQSYKNAHVLLYDTAFGDQLDGSNNREDEHIKVFFTEEKGLMMDYSTGDGSSIINIRPDNTIYIEYPNGRVVHVQKDMISLGQETESDEPAVLGNKNEEALEALADQINALAVSIRQYATTQASATAAAFPLAALTPALTKLAADQVPIESKIKGPIKNNTIPNTKSDKVTLD